MNPDVTVLTFNAQEWAYLKKVFSTWRSSPEHRLIQKATELVKRSGERLNPRVSQSLALVAAFDQADKQQMTVDGTGEIALALEEPQWMIFAELALTVEDSPLFKMIQELDHLKQGRPGYTPDPGLAPSLGIIKKIKHKLAEQIREVAVQMEHDTAEGEVKRG